MNSEFIPIGKVLKPHGIKGALKVYVLSDIPGRLKGLSFIYSIKDGKQDKLDISYCRLNKDFAIMGFKDIDSISLAEKFVGNTLCIKEETLALLPANSYYIHKIVGLEVIDEIGNHLGRLKEVWQMPANDVFVVKNDEAEILFPAVKEAIKKISSNEIIVNSSMGVM